MNAITTLAIHVLFFINMFQPVFTTNVLFQKSDETVKLISLYWNETSSTTKAVEGMQFCSNLSSLVCHKFDSPATLGMVFINNVVDSKLSCRLLEISNIKERFLTNSWNDLDSMYLCIVTALETITMLEFVSADSSPLTAGVVMSSFQSIKKFALHLHALADVLAKKSLPNDAAHLYQICLSLLLEKNSLLSSHVSKNVTYRLLNSIGSCLYAGGNWEGSLEWFQHTVDICDKNDVLALARSNTNVGASLYKLAQFDKAKIHYEEAIAAYTIAEMEYPEDKQEILSAKCRCLSSLGTTLIALNNTSRAKVQYEEALTIATTLHGHHHQTVQKLQGYLDAIDLSNPSSKTTSVQHVVHDIETQDSLTTFTTFTNTLLTETAPEEVVKMPETVWRVPTPVGGIIGSLGEFLGFAAAEETLATHNRNGDDAGEDDQEDDEEETTDEDEDTEDEDTGDQDQIPIRQKRPERIARQSSKSNSSPSSITATASSVTPGEILTDKSNDENSGQEHSSGSSSVPSNDSHSTAPLEAVVVSSASEMIGSSEASPLGTILSIKENQAQQPPERLVDEGLCEEGSTDPSKGRCGDGVSGSSIGPVFSEQTDSDNKQQTNGDVKKPDAVSKSKRSSAKKGSKKGKQSAKSRKTTQPPSVLSRMKSNIGVISLAAAGLVGTILFILFLRFRKSLDTAEDKETSRSSYPPSSPSRTTEAPGLDPDMSILRAKTVTLMTKDPVSGELLEGEQFTLQSNIRPVEWPPITLAKKPQPPSSSGKKPKDGLVLLTPRKDSDGVTVPRVVSLEESQKSEPSPIMHGAYITSVHFGNGSTHVKGSPSSVAVSTSPADARFSVKGDSSRPDGRTGSESESESLKACAEEEDEEDAEMGEPDPCNVLSMMTCR